MFNVSKSNFFYFFENCSYVPPHSPPLSSASKLGCSYLKMENLHGLKSNVLTVSRSLRLSFTFSVSIFFFKMLQYSSNFVKKDENLYLFINIVSISSKFIQELLSKKTKISRGKNFKKIAVPEMGHNR